METNSAIVVVVDRLSAGCLGPYGNTWIETPHWNRLASQSLLMEFALADSPELDTVYRSYWSGLHAMSGAAARPAALAERYEQIGVTSILVTDEPRVARHELAEAFHERVVVSPPPAEQAAEEIEATQLAQVFAAAIEQLHQAAPPFLLWLHVRGMEGPWDAPRSCRERFLEEGDPPPPAWVDPPSQRLSPNWDPDEVLGVAQAYAGQVVVLDACLGALLDTLDSLSRNGQPLAAPTRLTLTSPRGFPLGEHGRIGACDESLYEELLHVPWITRLPDQSSMAQRRHALVQPHHLYEELLSSRRRDAADAPTSGGVERTTSGDEPVGVADRACAIGPGQRAIRTPAWFLYEDGRAEPPRRELYVKPDDRVEVNEVSDRCRDVASQLAEALDQFQHAARETGRVDQLPPLAPVLIDGLE